MKREVPSLATVRPFLTKRPAEWVDAVLVGETSMEFAMRTGTSMANVGRCSQYVAEAAGLEVVGNKQVPIREAVLRMRIRELEERA